MIRFADSYPVSGAYQFGEIHVQVTKRKPQFLDAFPLPVDAFGGGNAQNAGSGDGIILIQFTRLPVSENVQGIRVRRFHLAVFSHHVGNSRDISVPRYIPGLQ